MGPFPGKPAPTKGAPTSIANRLTQDVEAPAVGLVTGGRHVLGVFFGAGLASVSGLLLAPRVWLHISQGLRNRLRHLESGLSKKQLFAPISLVGRLLLFSWLG
ncbi:hypothetical protein PMHK_28240 [Pseudomonas sp. MHK4]